MAADGTIRIATELDDTGLKAGLANLGAIAKDGSREKVDEAITSLKSVIEENKRANKEMAADDEITRKTLAVENAKTDAAREKAQLDLYETLNKYARQYEQTELAEALAVLEERKKLLEEQNKAASAAYNDLGKAVSDALKTQYTEEKSMLFAKIQEETEAIKKASEDRIDIYKKEYEAKMTAINEVETADSEIAALEDAIRKIDESSEFEKVSAQQSNRLNELIAANQAIIQAKNTDELIRAQKNYDELLLRQKSETAAAEREIEKQSLQEQLDTLRTGYEAQRTEVENYKESRVAAEIEATAEELKSLQEKKNAADDYYKALLDADSLYAESKKLILEGSNDEIAALLESYNSKWETSGKDFFEYYSKGLETGFSAVYEKVNEYMEKINALIGGGEEETGENTNFGRYDPFANSINTLNDIQSAESSAAQSYDDAAAAKSGASSGDGKIVVENQEININQPVKSAAEVAREIKNVSKELANGY